MEQLSANIAGKIALSLGLTKEREQVIAYGLTAMIQFFSIFIIITIIGLFGNFTYESILIFLGVGLLRKSTGGAHSETMLGCMIVSCTSITLFAWLSRTVLLMESATLYYLASYSLIFGLCFLFVFLYAPVDSPNKRIRSEEKRARLKKQSFIKVTVLFVTSLLLTFASSRAIRLQSLANSLCILTLWQCFTLTKTGRKVLHFIDGFFSN